MKKRKKKNKISDLSSLTNQNLVLTRYCGDLYVHQGLRSTAVVMPQSRIAEWKILLAIYQNALKGGCATINFDQQSFLPQILKIWYNQDLWIMPIF